MLPSRHRVPGVGNFESRRITGTWFRHVRAGGSPLAGAAWGGANGRWQRGEVADGLYLVESQDTAVAEWFRSLAEVGLPPRAALPRDLWRVEVDLVVADLSTLDQLGEYGLPMPTPDPTTWPPYQALGEELYRGGWSGLVAPSAARPAGLLLCVFRRGPIIPGVNAVPPPERWDESLTPPRGMTT